MPAAPDRGAPGLDLAGLLILVVLGATAWQSGPLEGTRPTSTAGSQDLEEGPKRVAARLWHDPFNATGHHRKAFTGPEQPEELPCERIRNELEGARTNVTILAVMLTPGPYGALEERRRRRRYALLSALGAADFHPDETESLEAFELQGPPEYSVPYEWYTQDRPSEQPHKVLVLWLNESAFKSQPFDQFRVLVEDLLPSSSCECADPASPGCRPGDEARRVDMVVLGPARSSTLEAMVEASHSPAPLVPFEAPIPWLRTCSGLSRFQILSYAATVPNAQLRSGRSDASDEPLLGSDWKAFCTSPASSCDTCLGFLRTIRSDDVVLGTLVDELNERGIEPGEHRVLAISEWDTKFGRTLPKLLAEKYCQRTTEGCPDTDGTQPHEEPCSCDSFRKVTYQRGIDGIAPVHEPDAGSTSQDPSIPSRPMHETTAGAPGDVPAPDPRRPFGTAQFDYVRRLAESLAAAHATAPVHVVAVLGSDVYDKLLVLQALRPKLPGALWITTDLDANFLHPAELRWTRNVVTATTFGLQLPNLELAKEGAGHEAARRAPPFRDSYQSSLYLATRLAVSADDIVPTQQTLEDPGPQSWLSEMTKPLLFEIGRHGPVLLEPPNLDDSTDTCSPGLFQRAKLNCPASLNRVEDPRVWRSDRPFELHVHRDAAVAFVVFALLPWIASWFLFRASLLSRRGALLASILLLLFLVVATLAVVHHAGAEPTDLRSGVSAWPAQFLRLATAALGVLFSYLVVRQLHEDVLTLTSRYFSPTKPPRLVRQRFPAVGPRLALVVAAEIVFVVSMKFASWEGRLLVGALLLASTFCLHTFARWLDIPSARSIRAAGRGDVLRSWYAYAKCGAPRNRLLRVFLLSVPFWGVVWVMVGFLGFPLTPFRGWVRGLSALLSIVSGAVTVLLLLLVVDALGVCVRWVLALEDASFDWTRARRPPLPPAHADGYQRIRLIGERTAAVTRLTYYPVITILLLLLARAPYFDRWGYPIVLQILVAFSLVLLMGAAGYLNHVARRVRGAILDELREQQLHLTVEQVDGKPVVSPQQTTQLIERLERLNIGAFRRPWEQPVVRAVLMLLSGALITYWELIRASTG